ncbi:hypothetical protein A2914_00510 [Candidatus Nomurabacteria bacterium RIFCSPLOWO2_01_FULL_41_21]|uniref:Putative pre-16S rRNA nuclease n=1 Tax=Candidatus Nomurabacteria bacterium RIFCSPLOWO2_01_FULL_41_21 TaxID=1801776 RepID=A0A1F6X2M8_9BACT|nr:MAG: hypothetical protein A2914_00510 [Candidatus Nomurabacteria bacterium RIFCSPLOWO2_01_FULL_41_21]
MKFLGIDYGEKRIGLATSDERGMFAFPKLVVENGIDTLDKIGEILKENKITEIVIGKSLDMKGENNPIMEQIEEFSEKLGRRFSLPVHKEKEFLTSVEARRYHEGDGRVDASAAALILQRYLDRRSKLGD